jgi:ubiquinone/menaquinone biosynthesis C-methylase UbiE
VSQPAHFERLAATYDELRPSPAEPASLDVAVVEAGRLAGERVLDVGCGTGRTLDALRRLYGCDVVGIDASEAMLAVARSRLPGIDLQLGLAEQLPFPDCAFGGVTMISVAHHFDRGRAFPEARRVLCRSKLLVVCNFDPGSLERWWLAPFFPSLVDAERRRMPALETLVAELGAAGFGSAHGQRVTTTRVFGRDEALAKIRGRAYSTFELIADEEYDDGVRRAERELPDRVEYVLGSLLAIGER